MSVGTGRQSGHIWTGNVSRGCGLLLGRICSTGSSRMFASGFQMIMVCGLRPSSTRSGLLDMGGRIQRLLANSGSGVCGRIVKLVTV